MSCNKKNKTIYRLDYVPKTIKNLKETIENNKQRNIIQRDPIADTFKNYLHADKDDATKETEDVDEYYERAKDTYSWFAKVTQNKPVDKSEVQKHKIFRGRTLYQVDYCDLEKDNSYKEYLKKTAIKLPADIEIPLTQCEATYRNPKMVDSKVYDKFLPPRPQDNLVNDDKLRDILHVTTGDSEYTKVIGKLGKQIVEEELHGSIKHFSF